MNRSICWSSPTTPERILAAVTGSPGVWPIAPVAEWQGHSLRYPLGVYDLEELTGHPFNLEAYRSVRQFMFIGDQDENDAVDVENQAYLSSLFGVTPVERWPYAEEIYSTAGADVRFLLESGVGHSISSETWQEHINFFRDVIAAE